MGTKGTIIIQESEGRMPQELCQQLLKRATALYTKKTGGQEVRLKLERPVS